MTDYTITSDGIIEAFSAMLDSSAEWLPGIYEQHMPLLGSALEDVMYTILEPNRYTGALQESITSEYDPLAQEVKIYPQAMRGDWDAGALLELGTGPIPNAPWGPIKEWADFRGVPAFPVWWQIREVGVKPHPFLQRTLDDLRTQTAMTGTAARVVTDMALKLTSVAVGGALESGGIAELTTEGVP